MKDFLPINRREMQARDWQEADFVYLLGDAYVDHPSFGQAIISRLLESHGYRVGMLPQPDWRREDSVQEFGRPRLGFLISSGNMDSMVNHYTSSKKRRSSDAYTPGGITGRRPDRAVVVYGNLVRRVYPDVPIIIGGIEASLRRLAHYDYWANDLKKSILLDSQADLLSYGMGERSILAIADALRQGVPVRKIQEIPGTVCRTQYLENEEDGVLLPSFEVLQADKRQYAESFAIQYRNTDPFSGRRLVEPYGRKLFVIQNPPAKPLSTGEMDEIYALPFQRAPHPSYEAAGGVPALSEVKFSLVSNRGCFGSCNFCALTFHQGRILQVRSHRSILEEAAAMTEDPDFKGYIHDVGGPTANFRQPACGKQQTDGACTERRCLYPKPCPALQADHSDYLSLLRKLREIPKVKKVFIRSGIRFDYVMADPNKEFLTELCRYHVSGQLKVAPEHVSDQVLQRMGKPEFGVYRAFAAQYRKVNEQLNKKQFLVPYLISSHPGSALKDAVALAECVRDMGYMPEQVQDFYPTPSTVSTCMYYTGLDPLTGEKVYTAKDPQEKAMQRALIQYRDPKNYELVEEALIKAGRRDLIGFRPACLIRPREGAEQKTGERKPVKKKTIRNVHKKKD